MEEEPKSPVNKILEQKHKKHQELNDRWDKFLAHVRPFIEHDEKVMLQAQKITHGFTDMALNDLLLIAAFSAEKIAVDMWFKEPEKLFCMRCMKEIEKEKNEKNKSV